MCYTSRYPPDEAMFHCSNTVTHHRPSPPTAQLMSPMLMHKTACWPPVCCVWGQLPHMESVQDYTNVTQSAAGQYSHTRTVTTPHHHDGAFGFCFHTPSLQQNTCWRSPGSRTVKIVGMVYNQQSIVVAWVAGLWGMGM